MRPGSVASPAVMAISSVPEKAYKTARVVTITPPIPVGKYPSGVRKLPSSGACWAGARQPRISAPPSRMNTAMAATLMPENQASASPNQRTE